MNHFILFNSAIASGKSVEKSADDTQNLGAINKLNEDLVQPWQRKHYQM